MDDLKSMRDEIDEIDGKIIDLVKKRAKVARQIGKFKSNLNIGVEDIEREKKVYNKFTANFDEKTANQLAGTIISYCKEQQRLIVEGEKGRTNKLAAVLGPVGTYADMASVQGFGKGIEKLYCDLITDVFDAVCSGRCEIGVIPLENSLEGGVNETMDCLAEYDVKIAGEIVLDIFLSLMVAKKDEQGKSDRTCLSEITDVYSHPHALAQCRGFLKKNCPGARLHRTESTAAAMLRIKKADGEGIRAAVGHESNAEIYGLDVLSRDIQDGKSETRFIVISKQKSRCEQDAGGDTAESLVEPALERSGKTTIIFSLIDRAGALYNILSEFAQEDINLTKIESRPSKQKLGDYLFFIDFEGAKDEPNVSRALEKIREKSAFFKILGSY